jgi:hypothetical protein
LRSLPKGGSQPAIFLQCKLANDNCGGPWAHSEGMVAWNDAGEGFIMQVTTPDWPGSGSSEHPRDRGNTFGCTRDNNVGYSQSFFALKLSNRDHTYSIFGDMNEQGNLSGNDKDCAASQNGRGGLFFVVTNPTLHENLVKGSMDRRFRVC